MGVIFYPQTQTQTQTQTFTYLHVYVFSSPFFHMCFLALSYLPSRANPTHTHYARPHPRARKVYKIEKHRANIFVIGVIQIIVPHLPNFFVKSNHRIVSVFSFIILPVQFWSVLFLGIPIQISVCKTPLLII